MTTTPTELEAALRSAVGGEVAFDPYTRQLFSRDASMYAILPLGVVFPRDAADVAATVALAREHGVPVLPRGAGTSLAGQTVGPGIVLDFSRHLHRILQVDPERRSARVQPGVVQDQLNRAAARHGLMFGPDTSTSNRATLGGMIGNNSAGSRSVRYGMTIDHVRALDVVLSDASTARLDGSAAGSPLATRIGERLPELVGTHRPTIDAGYPPHWRRSGGYRLDRFAAGPPDFARFVVGSEGTLVVVTEAEVGLVPKPRHSVIAVGHFTSTAAAIGATQDALDCDPTAVELLDRTILDLSRSKLEYAALGSILVGDPDALLFVTFSGDDEAELAGSLDRLAAQWERHSHGYHTLRATSPAQQAALLKVRSAGLGLLMAASEGTRRPLAFIEDTAVDPARLAEYAAALRSVLDRHGLRAGFYGHCSVGCLHVRPFVDLRVPDEVARMRAVAEEVRDLVAAYGGVNSSEHGDGLARSEFNRELFGAPLYQAMREVKHLFDPHGTLNPGKIVDAPSMTENLRDAALPDAPPLRTHLAFAGGMRAAADRCMNIGLCRKDGTGAMCPSYMATRNEEDSTRGRAGALVAALSAADPKAALGGERLHEILDLCLMCKACKSECPLGVDMAMLKAETLAQRHETHGTPLRDRVFGRIGALNRLGAATAPLSNLLAPRLRRVIGISPRRPLPRFTRRHLPRWYRRRTQGTGERGEVTFLADSFTTFTDVAVGRAAIELLERAGWRVRLAAGGCCGRASLSKGLLPDARRRAADMLTRLGAGDSPVVGVEPSCLLTFGDEYRALLPDDPRVAPLAARVRLVDDLLLEAVDAGWLRLGEALRGRRIVFHGHCHQKAEVGTAATVELLRRIPGADVHELDAGCCGMAGSFGFEAEHYDLSMTIGADRLFPAVNAEPPGTLVAATGVSCRQQIRHGTGRAALHPAQILLASLTSAPEPS